MEKMDGKSLDLVKTNIEALKQLFPEVVTEGKIDFEKLKILLGENIEKRNERYEFTWHGKTQAMKLAQTPSTGTLRPDKESSKNWDTTQNLYIEGDNLEVLKLLQKSYFGKIKMIYIDPPYNTGKDFVYKDDFRDNIKNYKEMTKQTTKANTETNGRYHTDWLNMMYPRLKLARNLLKDDGIIFISIDDNEHSNLKKICDEIFGETNFIGTITWEKRTKAQNTEDAKDMFQSKTEYILLYKKNQNKIRFNLEVKYSKDYPEKDEKGSFRYYKIEQMSSLGMRGRDTMIYPILGVLPDENKQWKLGRDTIDKYQKRGDLLLLEGRPCIKIRPKDEDAKGYFPFWSHFFDKDSYGTAESGKTELSNLLETQKHGFETVKPLALIKKLLFHQKNSEDEIILDFFSGSSTTAHAVMQLNAEDGGNRKFIMVQFPELIDENSDAYKAGFKTICEIGKERIRRAGEKIVHETGKTDLDIGFKVFKLDSSNVKPWDPDFENFEKDLVEQLNNIKEDRTKEDLLYEILLKIGLPLTTPMEEIHVNGKTIYNVGFGSVLLCLENEIDLDIVHEMMKHKSEYMPPKVVFKESGFVNDSVKTNAIQTLKKNGITDVRSV